MDILSVEDVQKNIDNLTSLLNKLPIDSFLEHGETEIPEKIEHLKFSLAENIIGANALKTRISTDKKPIHENSENRKLYEDRIKTCYTNLVAPNILKTVKAINAIKKPKTNDDKIGRYTRCAKSFLCRANSHSEEMNSLFGALLGDGSISTKSSVSDIASKAA